MEEKLTIEELYREFVKLCKQLQKMWNLDDWDITYALCSGDESVATTTTNSLLSVARIEFFGCDTLDEAQDTAAEEMIHLMLARITAFVSIEGIKHEVIMAENERMTKVLVKNMRRPLILSGLG